MSGTDRAATLRRIAPPVVLAAMIGALFGPVLTGQRGLSPGAGLRACCQPWASSAATTVPPGVNLRLSDEYYIFEPNEEFISRWVQRGVWPLWNPDIAHGVPTVAGIESAEYYPANLPLWPFAPFWTRGPRAILRIAVAFVGTFGFARTIGITRAGATFAALAYAFSGYTIVWLGFPVSNVAVLLPVILWTLERVLQTGAFGWIAALAVAGGSAFLGGHTPAVLHMGTAVVVWGLYRVLVPAYPWPRLSLGAVGSRIAAAGGASLLIGSAAVLPWIEYVAQNPGDAAHWRATRTLSWKSLMAWVVPKFYGDPASGLADWDARFYGIAGWENYLERTGYVGVAALLLAVLAIVAYRPRRAVVPWVAALLLSVIFVYDPPVVGALARALPGFAIVNNSKMVGVAAFALAILAGLGCDALLARRTRGALVLGTLGVTAAALGTFVAILWPTGAARAWLAEIGALAGFTRDVRWAAVPVVAVVVAFALARRGYRTTAAAVLLAVTMADLWRFGAGFNPMIRPDETATATPGLAWLRQHGRDGRMLPLGGRLFPGNSALRYELRDVRGADWVNVRHYELLLTGRAGHYDFNFSLDAVPQAIAALNVSHAVLPAGTPVPPGAVPVYDGELRVLGVDGLPRALVVHDARVVPDDVAARDAIVRERVDPRRTVILADDPDTSGRVSGAAPTPEERVTITGDTPNAVTLTLTAREPGWVVLNDTFFPGWHATVDGRPVAIHRANVAFRAVPVDAGAHEIAFRYRPSRAITGMLLAAATVLGMAVIGIAHAFRRRAASSRG